MDGLHEYLYEQHIAKTEVSAFIQHLQEQAYDTDNVMEDIPQFRTKIDSKNSVLFGDFDPAIYKSIQRYIYHIQRMYNIIHAYFRSTA